MSAPVDRVTTTTTATTRTENHSKIEFGFLFCSIWLCTIFCCWCCCCSILSVLCFIVCFPFGAHSVHDCKLVFLFDYLSHALHTRTTFSFCCATKHLLLPHLLPTSCAVNAKPWELNMSFWLCVE